MLRSMLLPRELRDGPLRRFNALSGGDAEEDAILMYALSHGAFARYQCGNYASANAVFDELAVLRHRSIT